MYAPFKNTLYASRQLHADDKTCVVPNNGCCYCKIDLIIDTGGSESSHLIRKLRNRDGMGQISGGVLVGEI
jgi:hypothetical protein